MSVQWEMVALLVTAGACVWVQRLVRPLLQPAATPEDVVRFVRQELTLPRASVDELSGLLEGLAAG